jgi:hypothetical protein
MTSCRVLVVTAELWVEAQKALMIAGVLERRRQ